MNTIVPDLYSYIGKFLDDIDLLHFSSTSKDIYKYTKYYRNKRIPAKKLSKIRKIASLKDLQFESEIYFGQNLNFDRDFLYDKLLQGTPIGMYGALVSPQNNIKNQEICYDAKIQKFYRDSPFKYNNKELERSLKITLEKDKVHDLLITFQVSDKNIEAHSDWQNVITQKFYLKKSGLETYFSQNDNHDWVIIPQNKVENITYYEGDHSKVLLTFYAKGNIVYLMNYKVIVTNIPNYQRKIVSIVNG